MYGAIYKLDFFCWGYNINLAILNLLLSVPAAVHLFIRTTY